MGINGMVYGSGKYKPYGHVWNGLWFCLAQTKHMGMYGMVYGSVWHKQNLRTYVGYGLL